MFKNLLKKKDEGFTLVEIIIVLAIVGLIFVIIFLAVTAAQRGQRDTARKDNVNRMIASIQQAAGNSNGIMPTPAINACGSGVCSYAAGAPAGEVAWSMTVNSPVTAIAAAGTTSALGWAAAAAVGCHAVVAATPVNAGATGYVDVQLDDGTTLYCKDY